MASNLVKDMNFDSNGFLWVSTVLGLQRFDGKTFHTIPLRNDEHGVHYDKGVNLLPLRNGEMLIATEKGIAFYNPANNRFRNFPFQRLKDKIPDQLAIIPLKEENNTVWLMENNNILQLDMASGKILTTILVPAEYVNKQLISHALPADQDRVFIMINSMYILVLDSKQKTVNIGYEVKEHSLNDFHLLPGSTLLVTTHTGMQKIDIRTWQPVSFCPFPGKAEIADFSLTTSLQMSSAIFLVGVNNNLWEFDAQQNMFTRKLTDRQDQPFFTANLYSKLIKDNYNNIWAGSYIQGIRKIQYDVPHIRYFGTQEREKNFVKCIYTDKKNNLVLSGMLNTGLQVFDTNGRFLKSIFYFEKDIHQPTVTAIEKMNNEEYLLFMNNLGTAYVFNRITFRIKKLKKDFFSFSPTGFGYYFNLFSTSDSSFLFKYREKIYQCSRSRKSFLTTALYSLPAFESFYLFKHSNGNIWLGGKGRYCLYKPAETASVFQLYDDVLIKCIIEDKEGYVWMATEKGLYKMNVNGKLILQYTTRNGLPDDGIYAITTGDNGKIWFSHNKGISKLNDDGTFFTMDKTDGLQENEFNTNSVFKTTDGELFFGGVNGISSFYPGKIKVNDHRLNVFVTEIKVKEKDWHADTSFWNLQTVKLPYNQNALAISFNALGPENAEQYNYQYKMEEVDEQWINGANNRTARYVLNPGEYKFLMYAGSGFSENVKPQKEIKIIIQPAWWQTWWFRISIGVLAISALTTGIILYNQRKLRKKIQEIRFQQQLQKERERISRDLHDNIGAYTSALIANADRLQATGNGSFSEAGKLKENAKQILSSLRETIWVLNSKEISITDFTDGFKQYANKMLDNYPEVQIQFEEKIENNKILSPAVALNLYRILQEALQNILKYAKAKKIDFDIRCNAKISILLKDDGAGFDPAEKGFGNGINNMEYRASEAGFDFIIESESGKGTGITLTEQ